MFVSPNPSKKQKNSSQNSPKTLPKPSRNPFKTLPKPSQNPPKPFRRPPSEQSPSQNRLFFGFLNFCWIFFDFLMIFGLPKSSQNPKNSQKNAKKSMLKKHTFFNTIFSRFFMVLASENDSKIEVFSDFFRKRRFCKNCAPA